MVVFLSGEKSRIWPKLAFFAAFLFHLNGGACAETMLYRPVVSDDRVAASAGARLHAGTMIAAPGGAETRLFAWPDTPIGVLRTAGGYMFFGSDGEKQAAFGDHKISGSAARTVGTLDDPLGTAPPVNFSFFQDPAAAGTVADQSYQYLGGGPVYRVPAGMTGAGKLLMVTHAEIKTPATIPRPSFYSLLGLAASADDGRTWRQLGEIIRINRPYKPDFPGFEIGDPPLVSLPDGTFRIYFRDWGDGPPNVKGLVTTMSVAHAPVAAVLSAAFGPQPHAAPFFKYDQGAWTEPGLGGHAADLHVPDIFGDERQVAYDAATHRYILIIGGGPIIGYAESADGLSWSKAVVLQDFRKQHRNVYATPVGMGADPSILGQQFYVFYTSYPTTGGGWRDAELRRFTVALIPSPPAAP